MNFSLINNMRSHWWHNHILINELGIIKYPRIIWDEHDFNFNILFLIIKQCEYLNYKKYNDAIFILDGIFLTEGC